MMVKPNWTLATSSAVRPDMRSPLDAKGKEPIRGTVVRALQLIVGLFPRFQRQRQSGAMRKDMVWRFQVDRSPWPRLARLDALDVWFGVPGRRSYGHTRSIHHRQPIH